MSESGTVYLLLPSPRSSLFPDLISYLGLDIKVHDNTGAEYEANFPLKKSPAYLSKDGWKLHECQAILEFFISLAPESCKYNFYGKTKRDYGKVMQWVSFTNTDCVNSFVTLLKKSPTLLLKKTNFDASEKLVEEFEEQLNETPYLVGDEITLADIFAIQQFTWGIKLGYYDKKWFTQHPIIAQWYRSVVDKDPIVSQSLKGFAPEK